jgi:membrane associated rhomboid family serine protease
MMFAVLNPESKLAILFLPFGIKSKYLVGVLFAVEIICCIFAVRDGIGHWAHVGGALTGMLVVFYEKFNRKRRW